MLIETNLELVSLKGLGLREQQKKVAMIMGEGIVFVIIMALGGYFVSRSIRREIQIKGAQNNFILAITHELKTPLASLKLILQTIGRPSIPLEKKEHLLPQLEQQFDRFNNLINQLLLSTRLEKKEFQVQLKPTSFKSFFESRIQEIVRLNPDRVIRWEGPDCTIQMDEEIIWLVLANLIDNSLKYSSAPAPISIQWTNQSKGFVWTIQDEGIGIAKEDLPYIFDRFFRAGKEETRKTTGTGVGLYLSQKLIELHGGSIRYKSPQSTGSIFEVTLN